MQRRQSGEMNDGPMRKLEKEARLWQEATSDLDRGQFRADQKTI